ncbi:DNA-binding protein, partial [Bacillus cereus]
MNQLQVFNNKEFGQVRTVVQGEEVWFIAKDVCDVLEIRNSRQAMARLDEDEKSGVTINDGSQNRTLSSVN